MRIYVAGSTTDKIYLQAIRLRLVDLGHEVSSSWLKTAFEYSDPRCTAAHMKADAPKDLTEISEADLFMMNMRTISYGKQTELGAALAYRKRVWLIGQSPKPNIFYSLAEHRFKDWCSLFDYLEGADHGQ